ncbi:hypothetical protein M9Y38_20335, partial [Escherichia coli]|nr:hypothetical protein [Escherichia coli]
MIVDNPSPNRALVTDVYKRPDLYDGVT